MPVVIGTSGWQYDDWRGLLYPVGVPKRLWLEEYAKGFATVESNNAFYRLPTEATFADWHGRTPADFVWSVKASRYLTHVKRLHDPEEPVHRLLAAARGLGPGLGPVLLQLPPTLRESAELLDGCLSCFPAEVKVAVEFRHASWWTAEVSRVLERHGAALCWADRDSRPLGPLWRTCGWGYLRLHAGRAQPFPRYGRAALTSWARRLAEAWPDSAEVHVYFNNDLGGAAVLDAIAFRQAVTRAGRTATRTPSVKTRPGA